MPAVDVARIPPRWRRTVALSRSSLARDPRAAVVVGLLGAAALGLLSPSLALYRATNGSRPELVLPSVPAADGAVAWTPAARPPDALHQAAVAALGELLVGAAGVAAAIGLLAILLRALAQAGILASELAVHRAVGGSRGAIAGWLAGEGLVTAVAAVTLGLAAGSLGLALAVHRWPGTGGVAASGWPVPTAVVLLVVLLAALAPLAFSRKGDLASPPEGAVPLHLPILQFGFSLAFVTAAALLMTRGRPVDLSAPAEVDATGVVMQLDSGVIEPEARSRQYADLLRRLYDSFGPGRYAVTSPGAVLGLGTTDFIKTDCGQCMIAGIIVRWHTLFAQHRLTSPDSFEAGGMTLLDGREFALEDGWEGERVAVVNRHLALRHFEGGRAVGRDVFLGARWPGRAHKVIGIVEDSPATAFGGGLQPRETIYLSVLQHPPGTADLLVPSGGGAATGVVDSVLEATGGGAVLSSETEARYRRRDAEPLRWFGGLFGVTAVIMLAAAGVGTATMMALWIRTIAPQLALRRAVGCSRRRLLAFVGVRAAAVGVGGSILGAVLYVAVLRTPLSLLSQTIPWWPAAILARVSVVLLVVSTAGALVPAWRQARRPPAAYL